MRLVVAVKGRSWGAWGAAAFLIATAGSGCKGGGASHPKPDGGDASASDDAGEMCLSDAAAASKSIGQACSCAKECDSGFCVDGVCCVSACEGTCQSCGLGSSLGMCVPTPAGVKPRQASQCVASDPATCGLDGTCDGSGKCRNYEMGTLCAPGTCSSDAVVGINICDGAGQCREGAVAVCAPFSCDPKANACFTGCTNDANCVSGRKCVNGSCGLKMNGSLCPSGKDSECASNHCVDGVCCNSDCSGACRSCKRVGLEGTCSPVPAGQGHPLCPMQAPSTCGTTGACDGYGACSLYPLNSPCGPSSCSGSAEMNTERACDGLGTCQASELRACGKYRCANTTCNSICTTNAECADGIACVGNSCGPKVDGQSCNADADCQNQHCVRDTATGPGICCNTGCTGSCRSCALPGAIGRCSAVANGAADPRNSCVDMGPTSCGTDGKCDGAMACRRYATGTVCSAESCMSDVYTGPSTCNAAGQCLKPSASPCFPYRCNATKCFTSCTTDAQCGTPRVCGMNGMISSCGLKPPGATCSAASECLSNFCAQGVCCNSACDTACHACDLPATKGICSNVASGADPRNLCAARAQSTCGTTGQCSAGQCAVWVAGTQCAAASCPTTSTQQPPSTCNGAGTCAKPGTANCAPGRCDTATLTCTNSCTGNEQCTAPASCANLSCGLIGAGGSCSATNQCQAGLTCYLREGSPGVCCNSACGGTCESCRIAGAVGACTAVAAGGADPAGACVATTNLASCGLDGRCAGNNTASNASGTARCRFLGGGQSCRNQSCADGSGSAASTLTAAANCTGGGACGAVVTSSCGTYKCLNATQCGSSCTADAQCVGVPCNLQTHRCGEKLGNGSLCVTGTDCTSTFCVDGRCCGNACGGACVSCNNTAGNCVAVDDNTQDPLCLPAAPPCGHTGFCMGGACANVTNGTTCDNATRCDGREACQGGACVSASAAVVCTAADACHSVGMCAPATGLCTIPNAANGTSCGTNLVCNAGVCSACTAGTACTPANVCHTGTIACGTGVPVCTDTGISVANGTTCGTGQVCNGGMCGACVANTGCQPMNMCKTGTTSCATGTSVCGESGNKIAGTTCGTNQVCNATGVCVACTAGLSCQPSNQCKTGMTSCSTGASVCVEVDNKVPGASCGTGMVCNGSGTCVACTTGATCTSTNPCHQAAIVCSSGAPVCTDSGNKAAGTGCGTNLVCNSSGVCVSCVANIACISDNQCQTGTTSCTTGASVCTMLTSVAAGTVCGNNKVCDGMGSCGSCTAGLVCTTNPSPCKLGVTSCSTGSLQCIDGGNNTGANGTTCGTNQVCNNGSCVACTAGAACPSTNPCHLAANVCTSGAAVCTDNDNKTVGTTCGTDQVCNSSGVCVSCTANTPCMSANKCQTGTDSCASGAQVCTMLTSVAAGMSCGTNMVCDGMGSCGSCTEGIACTTNPSRPCKLGMTSCSTGSMRCIDGANDPGANGTTCGTDQVCNNGSCVMCVAGAMCDPANPCKTGKTSCATGTSACIEDVDQPNGTPCGDGGTCTAGICG